MDRLKISWKVHFWGPFLYLTPPYSRKVGILMARDLKIWTFGTFRKRSLPVADFKRFARPCYSRVRVACFRTETHPSNRFTSSGTVTPGSRKLTYNSTTQLANRHQVTDSVSVLNLKHKEYNETNGFAFCSWFPELLSTLSSTLFSSQEQKRVGNVQRNSVRPDGRGRTPPTGTGHKLTN